MSQVSKIDGETYWLDGEIRELIATHNEALRTNDSTMSAAGISLFKYVVATHLRAAVSEVRNSEIEFLYQIASDEMREKLCEIYKSRGANMGLSFILDNHQQLKQTSDTGERDGKSPEIS